MTFLYSFNSEWLKMRHSLASWLTITGGLLVPAIIFISRMMHPENLYSDNHAAGLWERLYTVHWRQMGMLVLPMGVVLVTSLITQMETTNNAWKLANITPQPLWMIYCNKLLVMLLMLAACLLIFIAGIYLVGILPGFFHTRAGFPVAPFPLGRILKGSAAFYVACLPILTLQYVISLVSKNYLVPIGAGVVGWMAGILGTRWKYGFTIPYIYIGEVFSNQMHNPLTGISDYYLVAAYTVLFAFIGLGIYLFKKQKGS